MRSTSRLPECVSILAGMTAVGLMIVAGCALDKPGDRPQGVFNRIGGHGGGQLIEPKRCLVKVVILNRPFNDPAINDVVWRAADEQIISPKERHALEANGLRIGRIIGELPQELEAILDEGGPQSPKVIPTNLLVESGQQQMISISEPVEQVSLLVNRDDRVSGKDYMSASGWYRLTPQHQGAHGVSVRLIPEIHHGPLQRTFPAVPNTGGFAPQELSIRDAQQEEAIHELSVDLMLEPGQVAVIGCRPETRRNLGSFLFSEAPTDTDQRHQKLILIWASRNLTGVLEDRAKATGDRPKLFQRLMGPPPADPSPPPSQTPKAAPAPDPGPAASTTKPAKPSTKPAVTPPSPDTAPPSSVPPPDSQAPPLPE
jgi:hypothetical protein